MELGINLGAGLNLAQSLDGEHADETRGADVVIVGSGPAGYAAAIYTARAALKPLVITSSIEVGGELMNTTEVENYPGFPEGIMGPDLMDAMQRQAERFGAELIFEDVSALELEGPLKKVTLADGTSIDAKAVIYATGSAYRKLNVPGEEKLSGHGVSWCATCDGAFFRDKNVVVVGGGDSAIEEATFLTRFAKKVTVVHRRDALRASAAMQARAFADPKLDFAWNKTVASVNGEDHVESVTLKDTVTGEETELPTDGVFVAIGADPRTHLVHGQLDLTAEGTVAVEGRSSRTNLPGVFAAGDVIDPTYRQAATASGSGVVAALDAEHYLFDLSSEVN